MCHELPFDLTSLHQAYAQGLAPQRVIAECARRIDAVDDPGIFIYRLTREQIDRQLRQLGAFDPLTRPLWGIPFVVKDNIDAADCDTTAACPAFRYPAERDAFVVELLKQAGAILIGKTNLDQFATGLVGVRTPYPAPRNALDPDIVPGGSSSGSAIAVARGLVGFALGTDTAGSGRVPAALNGIVGLKPTLGAISLRGVVPACLTLDTLSIFGLTVADAWRVFRVVARYDAQDPASRVFDFAESLTPPPHFSLGIPAADSLRFFGDERQADSFDDSIRALRRLGAKVSEIDFEPFYEIAELLYQGAWVAERYSVIEALLAENPAAVLAVTREVIERAASLSAVDAFRDVYRLRRLRRRVQPCLDDLDLLCVPSIPTFFRVADLQQDPIGPNSRLGTYTNFVNLLDLCGVAVPVDQRGDGRPGGVTLLARAGRDARVAAIAAALQRHCAAPLGATGWSLPEAPAESRRPSDDEIELAVVGAHMSGLPLNHELARRGGRFLRAGRTACEYRLFRLPGGPPLRPGLVRDASAGAEITLEVWALPKRSLGDLIAAVPAPLTIGTALLADGSLVKSFLCESAGLDGASEITRYGGWRAFLDSENQMKPNRENPNATT